MLWITCYHRAGKRSRPFSALCRLLLISYLNPPLWRPRDLAHPQIPLDAADQGEPRAHSVLASVQGIPPCWSHKPSHADPRSCPACSPAASAEASTTGQLLSCPTVPRSPRRTRHFCTSVGLLWSEPHFHGRDGDEEEETPTCIVSQGSDSLILIAQRYR